MEEERRGQNPQIQNNRYRYQRAIQEVQEEISNADGACLVLRDDSRMIGVIYGDRRLVPYFHGPVGMIEKLYVREDARGHGAGHLLLEAWIHAMKQAGACYLSGQAENGQTVIRHMAEQFGLRPYLYRMNQSVSKLCVKGTKMSCQATIEQMKKKDISQVVPLLRELEQTEERFDEHMQGSMFTDEAMVKEVLEERAKEGLCYISRVGEQIVGYVEGKLVYVHSFAKTSVILSKLFVNGYYRREGIGHQLVLAFGRKAAILTADFVWLQVLCSNETGLQFYQNVGFDIEAVRYLRKLQ